MVPYLVLKMIITNKKYNFLLTGIPLTFTTVAYHNNLIKNIRKYDIMMAITTYLHHILYYSIYSKINNTFYFALPGLFYVIDKICEEFKYDKTSYYFHPLCHLSVLCMVYLNVKNENMI
jgi:hypothetical protein